MNDQGRLYLKRTANQSIILILPDNKTIQITVTDITSDSVILKVNAEKTIKVLRKELLK
jgi:sRNA-binding carbon storage regulator CsrA